MIDFSVPEKKSYASRRNKSIKIIAWVAGILLVFSLLAGHDLVFIAIILAFFFCVQLYKSDKSDRYFLKHIKIQNEHIEMLYKDRDKELAFTGTLDHMVIRKEHAHLNRTRTIYLAIYSHKQLLLKQYVHDEWTEGKFDEIEQYIRKFKVIGKEIG